MTLGEFEELCGYWAHHPPVHVLVAAYLGVKPQAGAAPCSSPGASFGPPRRSSAAPELAADGAEFGLAQGDLHQGCAAAVVLDFAELKRRGQALGR